jgi:hypothetical protein
MEDKLKPASVDALNDLHATVASVLKAKILSEEVTAADISNAIKFLKDNGINCPVDRNDDLLYIEKEMPKFMAVNEL